jgi:glycosyltransferase involved in cell wall biosynthesis
VKPLISILIPAFNAEDWIADTLRSAIAQTWEPKEIIVVDDGSTDDTVTVARQFAGTGVRVATQANQGAAAARNHALSLSRGDFIQWLDADDLLAADKVERQMAQTSPSEARVLLSSAWGRFIYRYHRASFIPTGLWADLSRVEWLLRKMGENLYMQTATWLVSRELTDAAGPWDTRLLGDDDGEYFCRVLLASKGVRFVPDAKVYYRKLGAGALSYVGTSNRKIEAHWRSMKSHIAYLRSLEESDRVRAACVQYLQTSLIYFYPERPDVIAEAEQMAASMGRQLSTPRLSRKFSWINSVLGCKIAKRTQVRSRRVRASAERFWDRTLLYVDKPPITVFPA